MDSNTQRCPLCAEDIPRTATACPYCGAKFSITSTGYCTTCHDLRTADANGLCTHCGTALADLQIDSQLIQPQAPLPKPHPTPPANPPPRVGNAPAASRRPKRNTLWLWILAIGLVLFALYLLIAKENLPASFSPGSLRSTSTPRPSFTPLPSLTPEPTSTPRPSPTATPEPVEVTFDTLGDYPGELVILIGRLVLTKNINCRNGECGLLLENPANTSQKITMFIIAGDEPNQLKPVPETYTKGDIKVRLDDGTDALVGYRLRITGRVCETTDGDPCLHSIHKIELYQVK